MHGAGERDPGLAAAVPFRFACSRCGHCCSGGEGAVWVEPREIEPLAAALGMTAPAFAALHLREALDPARNERRIALLERADGRCTLLEGRNTCRAYAARPEHCRTFPYWPSVLAGGAAFEAARATCPGIAVAVDPQRAASAFARLADLYAALDRGADRGRPDPAGGPARAGGCCLEAEPADDLLVSALEADYAAAYGRPDAGCRLGPARPLGCRLAGAAPDAGEQARAAVRAIERETGHPTAYGAARALLAARGVPVGEEPR